MKSAHHKLIALLGLAGSLTLSGLAMADNYGNYSPKFSGHHAKEQRHDRGHGHNDHGRHQRETRHYDNHDRHQRHDRHAGNHGRHHGHHRPHHNHGHGHHHAHRYGHYHGVNYCALDHGPAYYYGGYSGAYVSGAYVSPSLGLYFDLR